LLMQKKGLSEIISTVLLILISVVAVSILAYVLIPMIKEWTSGSSECFNALDKIKIVNKGFTCYDSGNGEASFTVSLANDVKIKGIAASIGSEGSSKVFEIYNSSTNEDIKMYNGDYGEELELPNPGEERTYIINYAGTELQVGLIMEKKTCDFSDSIVLESCEIA